MKAVELLDIVNCQCTEQSSYDVQLDFNRKHDTKHKTDEELEQYLKEFFLGKDGVVLKLDHDRFRQCEHLVGIYPIVEYDEEYHDFLPANDESVFIGLTNTLQMLHIYNLE